MPIRPLPDNPNLEHLRGQAKTQQRKARHGDTEALALIAEFHPRPSESPRTFTRTDAQLVIARQYGFASWPRLVAHLAVIAEFSRDTDPTADPADDLVNQFLRLACLSYTDDRPEHTEAARQLLAEHPEISTASIHTIAATGSIDAARKLLIRDPLQASTMGGPYNWEPLCYLAYSRLGGGNAVGVCQVLLEAGADPDAGYLWRGMPSPFTALTGAFGGGEQDQPVHPESLALARLLLAAGADPNDNQSLYNRMFSPVDDHLELLFHYGLGTDIRGPWRRRLGDAIPSPAAMVGEQLRWAAAHDMVDRVRLLLDNGVNADGIGYHPSYGSKTAYDLASMAGNRESAQLLAGAGATVIQFDDVHRLLAACMAGERTTITDLINIDPALPKRAIERMPDAVVRAAYTGRIDAVRLALELGGDVNATAESGHRESPLHAAAQNGHVEIARLLLADGADRDARDCSYNKTPLEWAQYCDQRAFVELLGDR